MAEITASDSRFQKKKRLWPLKSCCLIMALNHVASSSMNGEDQRCHQRVLTNSSHKQKGKLRADRLNKIKGSSSGRHMTSSNSQLNKSTPYHHRLRISEKVSLSQYKGLVEGRSFKDNERHSLCSSL